MKIDFLEKTYAISQIQAKNYNIVYRKLCHKCYISNKNK